MSYIILAARNIPDALGEVVSCASRDLLDFFQHSKIIRLSKSELIHRKTDYNEVVITEPQCYEADFFNRQSINYPHRVFILVGKPFYVVPKNVIGFFENSMQLRDSLMSYVEYLNLSKKMVFGNKISIFLSEIICAEIRKRKLVITTMNGSYNLGYRTLKSFMLQANNHFCCVNRSIAVNMDYVCFLDEKQIIKLENLKRNIYCSRNKYQNLIQKYKM